MVYTKIMLNNLKEYTPSFIRTIPYSQVTKPFIGRKAQIVSKFNADPKVKRFWRFFQRNIQKHVFMYQIFMFGTAFTIWNVCTVPWVFVYQMNNRHRTLDAAIANEKEFKRKQKEAEGTQ